MGMRAAVETRALVKRFGTVEALAGVDLHLPVGGVLGLLGPNGAGKTTAVRVLCLGGPTTTVVWQAMAWISGLLAVAIPAAVLRYRRTTAAA